MAGIRKSADLGTKGVRNIADDAVFPSTVAVTSVLAGTGISVSSATGAVTVGNTGVTGLAGTANQITVSASTGSVTISIPTNPSLSGTVTAGGFSSGGAVTLNRATATAWNAGANINLQVDGTTYVTLGVDATNSALKSSGSFSTPTTSGYAFGDHGFSNFWRPVDAYNNSYFRIATGSWYSDAANYYFRNASSTNNVTIDASGNTGVRGAFNAYSISGNSNVAGTGNASYHPSGIYSTGTNWLYGTIYTNGNSIYTSGGGFSGGNYYATGAYNGPLSNSGAILRMRSGNEGSWLWDGTFRFYVDASNVKNFTIQHPIKPNNYLVHACAEGPTSDVFYRGEGRLTNGRCVIDLPDYFEELTELEGRSIMLTPIADENGMVANLAAYEIYDGHFLVEQIGGYNVPDQRFWWRVDAVRKNTSFPVEPTKDSVEVGGFGPYTFIKETA